MPRNRMSNEQRREQFLSAAYKIAKRKGLCKITRKELASVTDTSIGLSVHYFHSMPDLYLAVRDRAIETKDVKVLADAVNMGYGIEHAPRALQREVKAAVKH